MSTQSVFTDVLLHWKSLKYKEIKRWAIMTRKNLLLIKEW